MDEKNKGRPEVPAKPKQKITSEEISALYENFSPYSSKNDDNNHTGIADDTDSSRESHIQTLYVNGTPNVETQGKKPHVIEPVDTPQDEQKLYEDVPTGTKKNNTPRKRIKSIDVEENNYERLAPRVKHNKCHTFLQKHAMLIAMVIVFLLSVSISVAVSFLVTRALQEKISLTPGPPGTQGIKGSHGVMGVKGQIGQKGDRGITGTKGSTGTVGPKGIKGASGSKGSTGSTGSKGQKGDVGAPA